MRLGTMTSNRISDAHELYAAVKGKINQNNITPRMRIQHEFIRQKYKKVPFGIGKNQYITRDVIDDMGTTLQEEELDQISHIFPQLDQNRAKSSIRSGRQKSNFIRDNIRMLQKTPCLERRGRHQAETPLSIRKSKIKNSVPVSPQRLGESQLDF